MNIRLTTKTLVLSTLLLPSAWGASTLSFGELPSLSWKKLQRYVSPQLTYTNDYLSSTGGEKAGPRNIGALEIFLDSDLSKYSDVQGELLVHYVHLDSSDERAAVGDAQTASN